MKIQFDVTTTYIVDISNIANANEAIDHVTSYAHDLIDYGKAVAVRDTIANVTVKGK